MMRRAAEINKSPPRLGKAACAVFFWSLIPKGYADPPYMTARQGPAYNKGKRKEILQFPRNPPIQPCCPSLVFIYPILHYSPYPQRVPGSVENAVPTWGC